MAYLTGQVLTQADIAALFTSGTYTPTLTNIAIGTGGTPINTASYTFVGFPAGGVLTVEGVIKFGTTTITLPGASAPTISLPSGYTMIATLNTEHLISSCNLYDVSVPANYRGVIHFVTTTTVGPQYLTTSAPGIAAAAPNATNPMTWATGDEIHYRFSCRATGP